MSKSREEFELAIDNLKSSKTEDEILSHLTFIVKGFNISLYKDILLSNSKNQVPPLEVIKLFV